MRILPETYQELGRELQEDSIAAENRRADSELEEGKRRASNYRYQDMKTFLNQLYQWTRNQTKAQVHRLTVDGGITAETKLCNLKVETEDKAIIK